MRLRALPQLHLQQPAIRQQGRQARFINRRGPPPAGHRGVLHRGGPILGGGDRAVAGEQPQSARQREDQPIGQSGRWRLQRKLQPAFPRCRLVAHNPHSGRFTSRPDGDSPVGLSGRLHGDGRLFIDRQNRGRLQLEAPRSHLRFVDLEHVSSRGDRQGSLLGSGGIGDFQHLGTEHCLPVENHLLAVGVGQQHRPAVGSAASEEQCVTRHRQRLAADANRHLFLVGHNAVDLDVEPPQGGAAHPELIIRPQQQVHGRRLRGGNLVGRDAGQRLRISRLRDHKRRHPLGRRGNHHLLSADNRDRGDRSRHFRRCNQARLLRVAAGV